VPLALLTRVDNAYFQTMRIPLLAGRPFGTEDRMGRSGVVLINKTLALHWWTAPQLAVGHLVKFGGPYMAGPTYKIAGVIGDVKQAGLDAPPSAELYVPLAESTPRALVVMIRGRGNLADLMPIVRRDLASVDSGIPVQSLRPFEQWMGATLARRRFSTLLFGVFAALALLLSSIGIYGVLNYWVKARQKEIAIRLALGAQRATILRWTGKHAAGLIVAGVALGLLGCWGASRWLASIVFGIAPRNATALFMTAGVVIAIAALAAMLPAWRASRVDVTHNLRDS
jgi:hypothetical protein